MLITTTIKQKTIALKKAFNPRSFVLILVSIFVFSWPLMQAFNTIIQGLEYYISFIILYLVFIFIEKIFSKEIFIAIIVAAILRIVIDDSIYSLGFLKFLIITSLVFGVLRLFILNLGFFAFSRKVKIKDLKQGMIPAEIFYNEQTKKKTEFSVKKILYEGLALYLTTTDDQPLFKPEIEGLKKSSITKLKNMKKKHPELEYLSIHTTLPFAPFLFIGVLLTIILKTHILTLI